MFTSEGIVDVVTSRGCAGWTSENHRRLAVKVVLGNPLVQTLDKLREVCGIINGLEEKKLGKEELMLKANGIIDW